MLDQIYVSGIVGNFITKIKKVLHTILTQFKRFPIAQDASCSLKEISGQVVGKLGLEMQLTHLHDRSRNS